MLTSAASIGLHMIPVWFRGGIALAGAHYQLCGGLDKEMKETYLGHKLQLIREVQQHIDSTGGRPPPWITPIVSTMSFLEVSLPNLAAF